MCFRLDYGTVKLRTAMCSTLVTRVEGGVEGVGTAGVVSSDGVFATTGRMANGVKTGLCELVAVGLLRQ